MKFATDSNPGKYLINAYKLTILTRSLWRDWSSTGIFFFYNLQKF